MSHVPQSGGRGIHLSEVWLRGHEDEEDARGAGQVNTFKIKPGEWEALTSGGLTIHAVLNGKDVSQWLALMKDGHRNVLVLVTEPEYDEADPLKERRHVESDPI